jgi:hypothetical protein
MRPGLPEIPELPEEARNLPKGGLGVPKKLLSVQV